MKKYLMIGAAALMIGASFTSCSKEKDLYDPAGQAERFLQSYADAFIKIFGQPAATQDWGFGSQAQARATRAIVAEANQWGDPKYGNWVIPDPLTQGQKDRVAAYFKANPRLTYITPAYDDYFVQQVYTGVATYNMNGTQAPLTGSTNMDKMTFGATNPVHVDKFNKGMFDNNSQGIPVTNTGCSTNDCDKQETLNVTWHRDQIQLLTDILPDAVGYNGSTGAFHHYTGRCALVAASVIDTWANDPANYVDGKAIGEKVSDKWNRDFVGLDFDGLALENALTNNVAKIENAPYHPWVLMTDGTLKKWDEVKNTVLKDKNGNDLKFLTSSSNMFIGNDQSYAGQSDLEKSLTMAEFNAKVSESDKTSNSEVKVLDMNKIQAKINAGYYPVDNGQLQKWSEYVGRDYYYSDWIVTLTPAKKQGEVEIPEYDDTPDYRIIAEDLTIADKGNDFDFNDVVFDVYYNKKNDSKAKIKLQAAGGTLPLEIRVGGQSFEVHEQFRVDVKDMVNTGAGPTVNDKPFFEVTINKNDPDGDDGIKLWVNKGSDEELNFIQLTAETGHVAAKIKVDHTYQWCGERVDIDKVYPNFEKYVKNPENYAPYAGKPTWWAK